MNSLIYVFDEHLLQLLISLLVVGAYFLLQKFLLPKIEAFIASSNLEHASLTKAVYIFRVLYGLVALAFVLFVWGFDFNWLLAISSGILTITGVALFANWSVLSNITAFVILLIHENFKRGNFIRIVDADNYVEGVIAEINIFNTILNTAQGETISYPNNLIIARPCIINPKNHYNTVGKIQEFILAKPAAGIEAAKLDKPQ